MSRYVTVSPRVEAIHRRSCQGPATLDCVCPPKYRVRNRAPETGYTYFTSLDEARKVATEAPGWLTVPQAIDKFEVAIGAGTARAADGQAYRPSVAKLYIDSLERHVAPSLGSARLDKLSVPMLTRLVDELVGKGLAPNTIRTVFAALRAMYRWAAARGYAPPGTVLPTVQLPAGERKRDRVISAAEIEKRLGELDPYDRVVWALAFYAGLRRGEIAALRWEDVELDAAVLRVEVAYSYASATYGPPKTEAGRRRVPIPAKLREILVAARRVEADSLLAQARYADATLEAFAPRPIAGRFHSGRIQARAAEAWRRIGLEPMSLHEARHCYASLMIDAGLNIKQVQTYMGHANVQITLDRYSHLLPDDSARAVGVLNGYLES